MLDGGALGTMLLGLLPPGFGQAAQPEFIGHNVMPLTLLSSMQRYACHQQRQTQEAALEVGYSASKKDHVV